jgi:pyrroloquinoline quinone biosynthesis protein B
LAEAKVSIRGTSAEAKVPGRGVSGGRDGELQVRLLGTSAGGGLPQWNCACENCLAARAGSIPSRTQSSLAVSADGERWLLVNASPDIRQQAQGFALSSGRGSKIAAVALTSADVDHAAGLFVLREGGAPPIYATPPVLRALEVGLGVVLVLSAFGKVHARPLSPNTVCTFSDRDGEPLGIEAKVIPLAGRPPPYMRLRGETADAEGGDTIALVLRATGRTGKVLYAPGIAAINDELQAEAAEASAILIDGTCFMNEETVPLVGRTSAEMGHLAIAGKGGTLEWLAGHGRARRIYVHINNTNPVLALDSDEREEVEGAGVEVGEDGVELGV